MQIRCEIVILITCIFERGQLKFDVALLIALGIETEGKFQSGDQS